MARPISANPEATKARILDSAARLFSQAGPEAVSVRKVAQQAGVTLATVHHYFGPKASLYRACVQEMYRRIAALKDELLTAATAEPEQRIERSIRASFRFAWSHRDALRLLMRTVIDTGHQPDMRLENVHLPFLEQSSLMLAERFGGERSARLAIQSILHLCVRYALTDSEELRQVTMASTESQALDVVENHLVALAQALCGPMER